MSTGHRDSYSDPDAEHMRFCETDPKGPVYRVREEMGKMNNRLVALETAAAVARGADEALTKRAEMSAKRVEAIAKVAAFVVSLLTAANIGINWLSR
jgi:hypothetical protein